MGSALCVQLICPFVCLLLNLAWTLIIFCLGLPVLSSTCAYTCAHTYIRAHTPSPRLLLGPWCRPVALQCRLLSTSPLCWPWGVAGARLLLHACGSHCRHLEHNSLVEVNSGSLYGLTALHQLHLGNNSISRINRDGWSFCQKLHEL